MKHALLIAGAAAGGVVVLEVARAMQHLRPCSGVTEITHEAVRRAQGLPPRCSLKADNAGLPPCGGFWGDVQEGQRRQSGLAPACVPNNQSTVDAGGDYADDAKHDGVLGPFGGGGLDALKYAADAAKKWASDHVLELVLLGAGAIVVLKVTNRVLP